MASVDLLFSGAPLAGPQINLIFGETDVPVIASASLTLQGAFPSLTFAARLRDHRTLALTGQFAPLLFLADAAYASNTQRPTVGRTVQPWQVAAHEETGVQGGMQSSLAGPSGSTPLWQSARATPRGAELHHDNASRLRQRIGTVQTRADSLAVPQISLPHQDAVRSARAPRQTRYETALRVGAQVISLPHQEAFRNRRSSIKALWQVGVPFFVGAAPKSGKAVGLQRGRGTSFQKAMRPPAGVYRPPVLLPSPFDPCYLPDTALLFGTPWSDDANLVFICERHASGPGPATVIVPVRRIYVTINSITLHRVDTGAELHAHSFSMSLDYQSWTWSWQASLHHDAAAHLGRDSQGDPAELVVAVNGVPFRLRLERIARDRRFSPTRWAVGGRGKAAVLDAPYAPTMSFGNQASRTAQQLMGDVLTVNGVSLGWGVDWGLTDWPVPAGAWALQGPYIAAINDIAGAAGGYVQPHPTAAVLRVLPRYPAAPWAWAGITPDFELPADAAEVEGIAYNHKPAYNRVFVSGVGAGVFGPFKRAGTAGEALAPMVTHPLITHADAHRQRGLAEISDTGRQEHVSLNLQVLPQTGVIMPGQFVRYRGDKTYMGIVRSTSIDWSRPKLRQTIGIETHA